MTSTRSDWTGPSWRQHSTRKEHVTVIKHPYDLVLVRLQVSFVYMITSLFEASFSPTYRIWTLAKMALQHSFNFLFLQKASQKWLLNPFFWCLKSWLSFIPSIVTSTFLYYLLTGLSLERHYLKVHSFFLLIFMHLRGWCTHSSFPIICLF